MRDAESAGLLTAIPLIFTSSTFAPRGHHARLQPFAGRQPITATVLMSPTHFPRRFRAANGKTLTEPLAAGRRR